MIIPFRSDRLLLLYLLFVPGVFGRAAFGRPANDAGNARQAVVGSAVDLSQEKDLQKKVSVVAPGIPLSDALEIISAKCGVRLNAMRPIADQRVTLVTQDLPLPTLLQEIVKTLSHATDGSGDYEWRKTKGDDNKDQYLLVTLVSATARQRKARAAEVEQMAVLLREWRDRLSSETARTFKEARIPPELLDRKDFHLAVYHQAIQTLSDQDIDALVQGRRVPIPAALLTKVVAAYDQQQQADYVYYSARQKPGFSPLPVPVPTKVSSAPHLTLHSNQFTTDRPGQSFWYVLGFKGVFDDANFYIDPNYHSEPPLPAPATDEPVLDLTTTFALKEKDRHKQSDLRLHDLPTTLVAIAQAAKINVVQEYFYKVDWGGGPIQGLPLKMQKGKATALLNNVCATWKYAAIKNGNVYRLWSLTWATDRDYDIGERQLKPWRKTLAQQGAFTVADQVGMATEFSWGQIAVTLKQVFLTDTVELPMDFPDSYFSFFNDVRDYSWLRLLGFLSPEERQAASSDNGVPVSALNPNAHEEAVRFYRLQQGIPPSENTAGTLRAQLATARLFLKPPDPSYRKPRPMSVRISTALK